MAHYILINIWAWAPGLLCKPARAKTWPIVLLSQVFWQYSLWIIWFNFMVSIWFDEYLCVILLIAILRNEMWFGTKSFSSNFFKRQTRLLFHFARDWHNLILLLYCIGVTYWGDLYIIYNPKNPATLDFSIIMICRGCFTLPVPSDSTNSNQSSVSNVGPGIILIVILHGTDAMALNLIQF